MPTVSKLKSMLQAQVAPGNDDEFLRLLQEADIRLLEFAKWRWTRGRATLTPVDGFVVLPATFAGILGAQVNGFARDIRDESFEFSPEGAGNIEVGGPGLIRLIDQGINDDGLRHYKVTGDLEPGTEILALCHYAPVTLYDPDIEDLTTPDDAVDTTRCPDMAALKLVMLGVIYEESNDIPTSGLYFATALRSLDNKEKTQRGGSRQQFNIRPNGPGIRGIRTFR